MIQITLKAARVNAGLSRREASEQSGIHANTIQNYEKGLNSPTYDNLVKLSEIYKMPIENIFLPKISLKAK